MRGDVQELSRPAEVESRLPNRLSHENPYFEALRPLAHRVQPLANDFRAEPEELLTTMIGQGLWIKVLR